MTTFLRHARVELDFDDADTTGVIGAQFDARWVTSRQVGRYVARLVAGGYLSTPSAVRVVECDPVVEYAPLPDVCAVCGHGPVRGSFDIGDDGLCPDCRDVTVGPGGTAPA